MGENILQLRSITKRFAGVKALEQVNLELEAGEVLALLGENGAGKSTLMKILAGVYRPDEGQIFLEGRDVQFAGPDEAQRAGISIIYQEFSLVPELSAYENIFLGREKRARFGRLDRSAMKADAIALLRRLRVELDVGIPVSQLSVAQQQFVEIAKALGRSARILILDEPTATLTADEAEHLFAIMRQLQSSGVAMIFISHHLDEIFRVAGRVQCLRDGHSVGIHFISDCTPKQLVRMIAGRDISQSFPPRLDAKLGGVLLEVRALQRERHLPVLSFTLRHGEILGFAGLVGSGRTEVMRSLIGADRPYARDIVFDGRPFAPSTPADSRAAGIGLLPEDRKRQGVILPFSVSENTVIGNLRGVCRPVGGWLRRDRIEAVTRNYVGQLAIKASSTQQDVVTLSGGNQQKVVLAKWLYADCRVLIFDEPTRGIDVGAKSEIYALMRALVAGGISIILISSDLPEVVGMSDRVIVMRQHRLEKILERSEEVTAESVVYYATGGHAV